MDELHLDNVHLFSGDCRASSLTFVSHTYDPFLSARALLDSYLFSTEQVLQEQINVALLTDRRMPFSNECRLSKRNEFIVAERLEGTCSQVCPDVIYNNSRCLLKGLKFSSPFLP